MSGKTKKAMMARLETLERRAAQLEMGQFTRVNHPLPTTITTTPGSGGVFSTFPGSSKPMEAN